MSEQNRPEPLGSDAFFAQVYDELRAIAHSRMQDEVKWFGFAVAPSGRGPHPAVLDHRAYRLS